jgi:predicted nucleotidyltransferase
MKLIIPGIENSSSSRIVQVFAPLPRKAELILFGSRAKGTYREGSDIDICLKGSGLKIEDRFPYLEKYEDLNLPWKLDVILYEMIQEPALKEHIDRVGILLPR